MNNDNIVLLPAIQWTGENLKDVLEFTGFWSLDVESYEKIIHKCGDVLELPGWKIKPGTWIVKTPDGFNIPLGGDYDCR